MKYLLSIARVRAFLPTGVEIRSPPDTTDPWRCWKSCPEMEGPEVALLDAMIERERDITYRTFLRVVGLDAVRQFSATHGYVMDRRHDHGTTLKHDWHVGYYRSVWGAELVYFIRWSAMEFIFRRASRIRTSEASIVQEEQRAARSHRGWPRPFPEAAAPPLGPR